MRLAKTLGLLLALLAASLGSPCALAEVVPVVSAANPVKVMSKDQVLAIFLGRMVRFPDGGPALPVDQPEGSIARDAFYSQYAGKSPAQLKAYWSKIIFTGRGQPPRAVANDAEVKRLLSQRPEAIGYIDRSSIDSSVKSPVAE